MTRAAGSIALSLLLAAGLNAQSRVDMVVNDPVAIASVDRAIARMGGEPALRAVTSVRLDLMTQWQRIQFSDHPSGDRPSYERNVELRDYATRSWRNTRNFIGAEAGSQAVDIVRDTVGARRFTGPAGQATESPLNIAYVDERRELFGFAPERMLLLAKDAGGLRALPDTTIAGVPHARVAGSADGVPATFFLNRADGLPAMVRFRASEDNDFGLAPWGTMEIEFWYSNWSSFAPGVLLPRQRDVRRVGRSYKRMTLLSATVNAPVPADSFAIADSMVALHLATQRKAMWDVSLGTVKVSDGAFVSFPGFTGSSGAVLIGGKWVLIETGQSKGAGALVATWLRENTANDIGAGIVTHPGSGNGGVAWFAEQRLPLYVAPIALPAVRRMLGSSNAPSRATVVSRSGWIKVGTDSLWLEVLDMPDFPGLLAVYSPTHKWLMSTMVLGRGALTKPEEDALLARLRSKGMTVEWLGTARAFRGPAQR